MSDSRIDPVCLIHGKKWSEHEGGRCLYCSICFKELTPDECATDETGQKWDTCVECWEHEKQVKASRREASVCPKCGQKTLARDPDSNLAYCFTCGMSGALGDAP